MGVSVHGGLYPGGLCEGGLCPGGLCPGGLCPGVFLSWGSLSREVSVQSGLCLGVSVQGGVSVTLLGRPPHSNVGQNRSYWNAFLLLPTCFYRCVSVHRGHAWLLGGMHGW